MTDWHDEVDLDPGTTWRKMGTRALGDRPWLVGVHRPTPGYAEHLAARVDRFLDHLGERPVLRRNWFVHPDPALHQAETPLVDPVVPSAGALDGLHVRSERQTLRRLPSGWVLFTIRIQHDPLGAFLADPGRRVRFGTYVERAPEADLTHRGMAPPQVRELRAAFTTP